MWARVLVLGFRFLPLEFATIMGAPSGSKNKLRRDDSSSRDYGGTSFVYIM
jgi:hypothetical protein